MNILNKNVAVTDSYKQVGTVVSTIPEIEIWVIRVLVAKGYFGSCYVCKQSLVGVPPDFISSYHGRGNPGMSGNRKITVTGK